MNLTVDLANADWPHLLCEALQDFGFGVLTGAVPPAMLQEFPDAVSRVEAHVATELGTDYERWNLESKGRVERQVPLKYDDHFMQYLSLEATRRMTQEWLGPHANLRSQTVEVRRGAGPELLQENWHMNFKVPGPEVRALDLVYFLEDVDEERCCLELIPGSHRRGKAPDSRYLKWAAQRLAFPAGSMLAMDAKTWHRETRAVPATSQSIVHHLFVPHWVKPFLDYPRLLGADRMEALPEHVRTYLGWYSRPPASMQEFALPAGQRTYREGQWDL